MTTSSSIHSNAFNFLSFVETGVDPRTGLYTCSLSLPELQCNDLSGPNLPLRLGYSPLNTIDSGFGKGWTLQLSQYNTRNNVVSLASGETFKVTSTSSGGDGRLLMREQKIETFRLFELDKTRFRLVHKSGLVEELMTDTNDPVALPVVQYSPQGHRISLDYLPFPGGRLLSSVINADGTHLLGITRQTGAVLVRLHPNTTHEALFKLALEGSDSRVARIELPTANTASWRFGYQDKNGLLCISRVEGPLGGAETIDYDPTGHRFPGNEQRILPRVNLHRHSPGSSQPAIETRYSYSPAGNNFLGRNARGLTWEDNDQDNLYKVLDTYTYDTTEQLWDTASDSARRSIKRSFNRFHLITEELTEQGDAVKRVVTDYYASDSLPFDQQVPQCQLPKTVTTTFYRKSATAQRRDEVVRTEYDVHGNLTLQVQANGISEVSEYYPAAGADGCPGDPHGFVRHLKQKTVTPASADFGDAPVLRTLHRYLSQPGLSGSAWPWIALESETLSHVNGNNAQLQKTAHTYLNVPGDGLRHGRKSRTAVTLNGKTTFTDFSYDKTTGKYSGLPVLSTLETLTTSFDEVTKSTTLEHSLLNGRSMLERDDNDVEIAYSYDQLGRVTLEMVAPDTDFQAERRYDYLLVNNAQMQATQTATDVKKVQTRSVLDGLQRVVSELRQDVDGNPVTKPLREVYRATYDAFGQLSESTEIDWLASENLALTSHYTYDDWGEQDSVTGPDGVTEHTQSDPVTLQVETWRDGMGKTVTHNNLFEKPDLVERFDLAGTRLSGYEYFYDGLGRTAHEYDELGRFRAYEYDAFDRMTLSVLPDEAQVERRYAMHSREDLPTWIGVNGVVLGEQDFDGLERMYRSVTGGRERTFSFEAGVQQPSSVTTPSGQVIEYGYNQYLGEEPVWRRLPSVRGEQDMNATYDYDPHNARLLSCSESDQSLTRTYYSTGELKTEQRSNAGQTHDMAYGYSLRGRLLSYTDVFGQQQTYCYDDAGRLKSTSLGETTSRFGYNVSGQTSWIVSEDLAEGHSVRIEMEYDDFGRERLRTFTFDDGSVQSLEQHYDARDALKQRILRQGTTLLRDETFLYDLRGRLEDYACSGSELPLDPWGKPIRHQVFTFDALDNLIEVRTEFPGGENLATHAFAGEDPTQLSSVSNSHADYPALISLEYDADGNLIRDEQGRTLSYDALGRLLNVSEGGSQALQYRYDAQDILSGSVGGEGAEQRFYCDGVLVSQLQGSEQRSFIRGGEHVLAERVSGQDDLLLATDAKKTVLAERDDQTRQSAYSAYGHRSSSVQNKGVLGFDGEYQEYSGVYLLGSYRAYSPALMVFCSPDSWSPFGDGGLNPYAYCLGDPVNMADPTGHMPWWATLVAGIGATILTAGVAALAAPALALTAATAATIGKVTTVVTLGSTAVSVGSGVASEFVEEGPLKEALSWGSFATGVIAGISAGAALGIKGASSGLLKKAAKGPKNKGNSGSYQAYESVDDGYRRYDSGMPDYYGHLRKPLTPAQEFSAKQVMPAPPPNTSNSALPGGVRLQNVKNSHVYLASGREGGLKNQIQGR